MTSQVWRISIAIVAVLFILIPLLLAVKEAV